MPRKNNAFSTLNSLPASVSNLVIYNLFTAYKDVLNEQKLRGLLSKDTLRFSLYLLGFDILYLSYYQFSQLQGSASIIVNWHSVALLHLNPGKTDNEISDGIELEF
jgi:hypothetical protein